MFGLTLTQDEKYLLLACQIGGVYIFNVTDPLNTKYISNVILPQNNFASYITIKKDGQIAFVASFMGITIINLKDILNPMVIGFSLFSIYQNFEMVLTDNEHFLIVVSEQSGTTILDIRDMSFPINFTIAGQIDTAYYANLRVRISNDQNYLFTLDIYFGIFIVDIRDLYNYNFPANLSIIGKYQIDGFMYGMTLSKDGNYLFISLRTKGIIIYDVRNVNQIQAIQYLKQGGHCYHIELSFDQQYLFYANALGIVIYERTQPNLNKDFPNMFNAFQSFIIPPPHTSIPWQIKVRSEQNHRFAYVAYDFDGIIIYNIDDLDKPVIVSQFNGQENQEVSRFYLSKNYDDIIYVSNSYNGFFAANLSNKSNPILYQSNASNLIQGGDFDDIKPINYNEDQFITSVGLKGAAIFQFSIPGPATLLSQIITFGNTDVINLSCDKKIAFIVARENGLIIVNITDVYHPQIITYIPSSGNEETVISKDCNYLYFAEGYRGLTIIDIQDINNPKRLVSLNLGGWCTNIAVTKDDKFAYAAQQDNDLIVLIDIQNKTKPHIIQKYNPLGESANNIELSNDEKLLFVTTTKGIHIVPLTPDITIQTYFFESNSIKPLAIGTQLKIGQKIIAFFEPIFQPLLIKIVDFYYYKNYKLSALPDWMSFSQSSSEIQMYITKQGLGMNLIIAKTYQQVNELDFVDSNLGIDNVMSKQIREKAQNRGYLTENYFLNENFNVDDVVLLNDQFFDDSNRSKKIKLILVRKINYIPIQFYIENSLYFLPQAQNGGFISTLSLTCSILIKSLNLFEGQFVKINFEGVLVSYSENLDQISLSGNIENVNQQLKKIIFARNNDYSNVSILITIDDNINELLHLQTDLTSLSFINFNHKVELGNPLQKQFNGVYDSGQIYITEQFQFQFSGDSFIDYDNELSYSAYYWINNDWKEISDDDSTWLKFLRKDRRIQGIPPQSEYKKIYTIKIVASDGYSNIYDIFSINVNLVPFIYIFNLLITVIAPIIGALGIFRFRYYIYGIIFKKWYRYSQVQVKKDQNVIIRIPLIIEKIELAEKILNDVKRFIEKEVNFQEKKLKNWLFYFVDLNQEIIQETQLIDFIIKNQNQFSAEVKKIPQDDLLDNENDIYRTIILMAWTYYLNYDKETFKFYQILKQNAYRDGLTINDWYKKYTKIYYSQDPIDENLDPSKYTFPRIDIDHQQILYFSLKYFRSQKNDQQENLSKQYKLQSKIFAQQGSNISNFQRSQLDKRDSILEIKIGSDININDIIEIYKKRFPNINYQLLIQQLTADAIGVSSTDMFTYSKGESIHELETNISSVRGMRKRQNYFSKFLELINLDYIDLEMNQNNLVPIWLKCEIKYKTIYLQGIPSSKDVGNVLIRITNGFGLIVRDFLLIIIIDQQNQTNSIKQSISNSPSPQGKTKFSFNEAKLKKQNTKNFVLSAFNNQNQQQIEFKEQDLEYLQYDSNLQIKVQQIIFQLSNLSFLIKQNLNIQQTPKENINELIIKQNVIDSEKQIQLFKSIKKESEDILYTETKENLINTERRDGQDQQQSQNIIKLSVVEDIK